MRLGNNIYLEPYLTLNFEWNTGLLLEASRPSRLEDKQVPGIDFCSASPDFPAVYPRLERAMVPGLCRNVRPPPGLAEGANRILIPPKEIRKKKYIPKIMWKKVEGRSSKVWINVGDNSWRFTFL